MKIKIDDKEFFGVFEYDKPRHQIKIKLNSGSDIIFFARWAKLRTGNSKKDDYVKNRLFETISREGTIINAFPSLDINEEFVELYFDNITVNWKNNI